MDIHFCDPVTPDGAAAAASGACKGEMDVTRNAAGPPWALGAPDQVPSTVIRFRSKAKSPPADFAASPSSTSGTDLPSSVSSMWISFVALPSWLSPRRMINQPESDTLPPCCAYAEDKLFGLRVENRTTAIKKYRVLTLRSGMI